MTTPEVIDDEAYARQLQAQEISTLRGNMLPDQGGQNMGLIPAQQREPVAFVNQVFGNFQF